MGAPVLKRQEKQYSSTSPTMSREDLTRWAMAGKLFALIDPVYEPVVRPMFEGPSSNLFRRLELRDTDPQFFEMIAWDKVTYQPPHLAQVPLQGLSLLLDGLPTERWGVFVVARSSLASLADHLQRFVIARGPDGNPYFLRFHDASVLGVLLATWSPEAKAKFFGPVDGFGLPDLRTLEIQAVESPLGVRSRKSVSPEACLLSLEREQLDRCSLAIENDLVRVIYWHLRNHHANVVQHLERTQLEERVPVAIERGRSYGFRTVSDLAGFSALMFELAPNFDDHPSFKRILSHTELQPEMKLRRLSQVISESDWQEALEQYDTMFWRKTSSSRSE